ncbi:MAG: hypothetical protein HY685_06285 [Chloroflexi bacterium]|nr:hypothetical protein [Chloroflexota bacterium]
MSDNRQLVGRDGLRPKLLMVASLLLLLLILMACTPVPTPTSPPPASPTPTVAPRPSPTPTPIPAEVREQVRPVIVGFDQAYRRVNQQWDSLYRAYLTWRQKLTDCSERDRRADLRAWVTEFQPLVERVAGLELPSDTAEVGKLLADAVAQEERGLRMLRDTWSPGSSTAFQGYEDSRVAAVPLRQQATARLGGLIAQADEKVTPTAGLPKLMELRDQVKELGSLWESFHQKYDAWRQRDGDCEAEAVHEAIKGFAAEFQGVSAAVFAISRPATVRPLAERLMEAVTTEGRALEALRDQWQPYDESHFVRYADVVAEASKLRRQVASELDQLLHQYSIPPAR